jgi:glycosyltransferase involved in cell wall biosynthesis
MRIDWYSPVPPSRSGIAKYTAAVLPELAKRASVTVWTPQASWDRSLETFATLRQLSSGDPPWDEVNRAQLAVYQVGNHAAFHGYIWEISCRHPGLVILHDSVLHDLFYRHYVEARGNVAGYLALMRTYYGYPGWADAHGLATGRLAMDHLDANYPLTEAAIRAALGVVVHSETAAMEAKTRGTAPVLQIPMPYPTVPLERKLADSCNTRAKGFDESEPFRLIVFGSIGRNRQIIELLRALGTMVERMRFRLDIYGDIWDLPPVTAEIREFDLADTVTVHGYVPEAELNSALDRADLAINLRFPTMGESSISQLQIWEHSLPALVTQVGYYATLPPSAVKFVRPGHELEDIQVHLRRLLTDPEEFGQMGQSGRRYLEEHHGIESFAEHILAFAQVATDLHVRLAAADFAKHLTNDLAGYLNGVLLDNALSAVTSRVEEALRVPTSSLPTPG